MFEKSSLKGRPTAHIKNNKHIVLNDNLVYTYWSKYDSDMIAPILKEMDDKDLWAVNSKPLVMAEIEKLCSIITDIEKLSDKSLNRPQNIDVLITILAYMQSSWAFRILKWFDDYRPSVLLKVTLQASNSPQNDDEEYLSPKRLFIDRMVALRNMCILSEIFNPEKMSQLEIFLDHLNKEEYPDD